MDRDKLAKLRKKSVEAKAQKHQELLDSNTSIKEAVLALNTAINSQEPYDDSKLVAQLKDLKESQTFTEDIKRLEAALKESSDKEKLDEVIQAVGNINNQDVVDAVNGLLVKLEENTPDQRAENFQPVRRVIKVGTRYLFDDKPTPLASGGGSHSSSVQSGLTRNTVDGQAIAIVNPDGTPIAGGGGMAAYSKDGSPYSVEVLEDDSVPVSDDPTAKYQVADVDDSGTTKYYGFTRIGGGWYILREISNTSPKTYRYAKGNSGYDFDNRASETYEYFHEVF